MKHFKVATIAICILTLGSPTAWARTLEGQDQESRVLSDKWYGSLGWFGADLTTDIAFGFGDFIGTSIRLEDDLSIEDTKDSFRFGMRYRFNRKHAISFGGFQLNRKGGRTIDKEIVIEDPDGDGGLRFQLGADIASEIDNDVAAITYNYSFYNNGKIEAGVNFGLSIYDFTVQLTGEAVVLDENGVPITGTDIYAADSSVTAPIPTYGIFVNYAIRKNLIFTFTSSALNLDVSDLEGRVGDTRGTVEWFFSRHVGVGVGISRTSIEVRDTGNDPYRVEYSYGGFVAHFSAAF